MSTRRTTDAEIVPHQYVLYCAFSPRGTGQSRFVLCASNKTNYGNPVQLYIYYHRTLRPSHTIACPLWSPVRDLGSPRDLWRGETKLGGLIREVFLGRGTGVRAFLATCARNPCASKFSGNPRRFIFGGYIYYIYGPSQNETCLGGGIGSKIRVREKYRIFFLFGRTRVCMRQLVCTE